MNVLFVTWDGPQVSYLESLFLPIFSQLRSFGYHFHVVQFSWADKKVSEARRKACEFEGVSYFSVPVMRKPVVLGALCSAIMGAYKVRKAIKNNNIDVVMPRSTFPALIALLALKGRSEKMIFDADGLPLDERVDFDGLSSSGLFYRLLRDVEAQAVRTADAVLTRSSWASSVLLARGGGGYHI